MKNRSDIDEKHFKPRNSVWRKIGLYLWTDLNHKLRRPALLRRFIAEGKLKPQSLIPAPDTFWTRSVVYWHQWMDSRISSFGKAYHLNYRYPGYDDIYIVEIENLIIEEVIDGYQLDITDVQGLSASKSKQQDIIDIDIFPNICCRDFVEPITAEHLSKNMGHGEIRLEEMRFIDFSWSPRRIHWMNAGESHHFASARHQAARLCIPIPLTGRLTKLIVNLKCIQSLNLQWHMYLIPRDAVSGYFRTAMDAFECPFGHSGLPTHLHCPDESKKELSIIWLRRDMPKAAAVAQILNESSFPNFGNVLVELAESYDTFKGADAQSNENSR
ncbi:hypothetical protein FS594_27110 (plasmid) [Rahnella aquatilis]|nr:hypothetical protein FS594_27110 [Rahnella aquatilis]